MKTHTVGDLAHTFHTRGDGLWGCGVEQVTITGYSITVLEQADIDEMVQLGWGEHAGSVGDVVGVCVHHTGGWQVYTDTGFLAAAQDVTGICNLDFTEQGMQEDGAASMTTELVIDDLEADVIAKMLEEHA